MAIITEEQLSKVRELRTTQQSVQMELGALCAAEQELKASQANLFQELRNSSEEIQSFMNELAQEYGHGTLNLETGEFIVAEQDTE
jgi:hypothetical protein